MTKIPVFIQKSLRGVLTGFIILLILVSIILGQTFKYVGANFDNSNKIEVIVSDKTLSIPEGYTFEDASSYGDTDNNLTIYCKENKTGKIYICTYGLIGKEIVMPEGYEFAGASAFGTTTNTITYYCRQISTGLIFMCH